MATGVCVGAGDWSCDDGNPCTQDTCAAQGGCVHTDAAGACSDGDACTFGDTCQGGVCAAGPVLSCDDGNPCSDESCEPGIGCVFSSNAAACDDGNACTSGDGCTNGVCVGLLSETCDDGNPCTADTCAPDVGCVQTPTAAPCTDDDACTVTDSCEDGVCVGSGAPSCDDGNDCTADSCAPETGCVFVPKEGPCDDGDVCSASDTCQGGACVAGPPLDCSGVVQGLCQEGVCDPNTGCQIKMVSNCCGNGLVEDGETCDDKNSVGGDGCDPDCQTEKPDVCFEDWLVGTPCNGVNYGNGCSPQDTGYHFKGIFDGYACWWHHKNQAWNTSPASNFWHLAEHFGVTPGIGRCGWCYNKGSQPNPNSLQGCENYFQQGNTGAWGWCAESDPNSVGFVCIPTEGIPACP